ncbi:arginine/serine-rich protein 1 isoform X1 [Tenrec ecaudatus]|uniref:arginine/serine-rich protein 1 isoform X1 n=1 Tax=Tenrec ecaudatus TaxID=94439 RepID=UPI003F595CB9
MSNYVNDLWPGSPQKESPATSRSSRQSSSRSPSPSSGSSRTRASTRSPSRSRSRPRRRDRSRSRSRARRRHQRKCRRYSRSYSRSRSRPRSRRSPARRREASRRARRSPPRRRPRSRSGSRARGRASYRPAPAPALARRPRYYGFGRTGYPEERRHARERSRTRSRSRTPLRLTEKDRMELLEIAKANAAKALGITNLALPASLRTLPGAKEANSGTTVPNNDVKFELSEKLTKDGTKSPSEKSSKQRSIAFSANVNSGVQGAGEETSSGLPKVNKKKSPYELWLPV